MDFRTILGHTNLHPNIQHLLTTTSLLHPQPKRRDCHISPVIVSVLLGCFNSPLNQFFARIT